MNSLLLSIILTLLPITELRIGLPIALFNASKNNFSLFGTFILILLLNIILIFFIFFFLDYIHKHLMKISPYKKLFLKYSNHLNKKSSNFKKRFTRIGFLALIILVAIPLPFTGAWAGSLMAWALKLNRKKSILAISLGVIIAGTIIFFTTLGALFL
jgi:uncharacterized membrane protein